MHDILIGNIFSFCAMITNSLSGTRKKHKEILGIQIVSFVFYGTGSFILKGYSSTVQNAVGIFRNIAAMKEIRRKVLGYVTEALLITAGVVLGIVFNNRGVLGILPVVANLEYSVAVFRFKNNERLLKIAFVINLFMYTVFAAVISDYVSIAANLIAAVTTAIWLIKDVRMAKSKPSEETPQKKDNA